MVDVLLVNPPCARNVADDVAPPLWTLVLAAIAESQGLHVEVLDLNLEMVENPDEDRADYMARIADRLAYYQPRLVAFSSMGVNTHVSLSIAEQFRARSDAIVIAGGPHFSAVAVAVLQRFSCIDAIAVGPGEASFAMVCKALAERRLRRDSSWTTDAGAPAAARVSTIWNVKSQVEWRGGLIRRIGGEMVGCWGVPRPSRPINYSHAHLSRYFQVNPRRLLDVEGGLRGCRFLCAYCYSPTHFGGGDSSIEARSVLADVRAATEVGARQLFFVADNFTNDPINTLRVCSALTAENLTTPFHCYATLAQLTPRVADALSGAGCTGVYIGADAVPDEARNAWRKRLYNGLADLRHRIEMLTSRGIRPTVAFLFEFASMSNEALESTVEAAAVARASGASVRLNTLSLYPGTPLYEQEGAAQQYDETKPRLAMDLPEVVNVNPYAEGMPGVFPFHMSNAADSAHSQVRLHAMYTIMKSFPETTLELARGRQALQLIDAAVAGLPPSTLVMMPDNERRLAELRGAGAAVGCLSHDNPARRKYAVECAVLEIGRAEQWRTLDADGHRGRRLRPFLVVQEDDAHAVLVSRVDEGVAISQIKTSVARQIAPAAVGALGALEDGGMAVLLSLGLA